jgi:hypothetical protein
MAVSPSTAAYYGAPPGWVGRDVAVQWDADHLLDPRTGQLLRELRRQERGRHRFAPGDEPWRTPPSVAKLLARASQAGPHLGELCTLIHHRDGIVAVRRILGLLALAKRYGVAVVEDACATALAVGLPEYRFIRRYLERRPVAPLILRQVDPLIRELSRQRRSRRPQRRTQDRPGRSHSGC